MIHRFDHCVVAAHDLASVADRYASSLGLAVYAGGRHTGLGTENAIVRFGLGYLELLSVYDEHEVRLAGPRRSALLDYLDVHDGGMLGFCLAAHDLDRLALRFADSGLEVMGPFDMQRQRPDGSVLSWRLLVPGGLSWRKPWPFFIEWALPDEERLRVEIPGAHAVGGVSVTGVSLVVSDLDAADKLYRDQIGLLHEGRSQDEVYQADSSTYRVGLEEITLLAPRGNGAAADFLATEGEGLFECHMAVPDLRALSHGFTARHVPFTEQLGSSILVDPDFLWGARLRFFQEG